MERWMEHRWETKASVVNESNLFLRQRRNRKSFQGDEDRRSVDQKLWIEIQMDRRSFDERTNRCLDWFSRLLGQLFLKVKIGSTGIDLSETMKIFIEVGFHSKWLVDIRVQNTHLLSIRSIDRLKSDTSSLLVDRSEESYREKIRCALKQLIRRHLKIFGRESTSQRMQRHGQIETVIRGLGLIATRFFLSPNDDLFRQYSTWQLIRRFGQLSERFRSDFDRIQTSERKFDQNSDQIVADVAWGFKFLSNSFRTERFNGEVI